MRGFARFSSICQYAPVERNYRQASTVSWTVLSQVPESGSGAPGSREGTWATRLNRENPRSPVRRCDTRRRTTRTGPLAALSRRSSFRGPCRVSSTSPTLSRIRFASCHRSSEISFAPFPHQRNSLCLESPTPFQKSPWPVFYSPR